MLVVWVGFTKDQWELAKNVATLTGVILAVGAALVKVVGWIRPRWREWRDRITLRQRVGAELYDLEQIQRSTAYYILPECQSVDPGGGEDFRRVVSAREPMFDAIDRLLQSPGQYKFVILLADSGMGKTSFLLNYYAHHWRSRRRKRFHLSLVPLNLPNSDELIKKISEERRHETVLCLDALDEDRQAIQDHRQRLGSLISIAQGFQTVIITCRTQFFPKEEEIPTETGVLKVGPVAPNEPHAYYFHKLYLAPFTDAQVDEYLKRRFPIWMHRQRGEGRVIAAKIPDLVARPMLLAHVPDLVNLKKKIDYSFQIYEAMVAAWVEREKGFVQDSAALLEFSERLAVDLFVNRTSRQMERIPAAELQPLADKYGIHLEDWQLRGRSLLNRDALGNYKFAHRSIMEYFFIRGFLHQGAPETREPWTDLMKVFLWEMIRSKSAKLALLAGADLSGSNLSGANLSDANLANANLSTANLCGVNLSGVNLSGADVSGADLGGVILHDTNLIRVNFSGVHLAKKNLSGRDLSGATFSGANLSEANLSEANLTEANLSGANLTGVNLSKAKLRGANLSAANLSEATHIKADLSGADLHKADLSGVDLRVAELREANLRGIILRRANLSGMDFRGADLGEANLSEADLSKTIFSGMDLSGVNLSKANLIDTNLNGANLSGANFSGVDLRIAQLREVNLRGIILRQANLSGMDFRRADLGEANLSEADLNAANLSGMDLSEVNLSRAKLSGANFGGANLSRADLTNVDLREAILGAASFRGAILRGSDLRGKNLSGLDFRGANLSGANLSEANLSKAKLSDAYLNGADLNGADLSGADFLEANFLEANLSKAKLHGANLLRAHGLDERQVASAIVDSSTLLDPQLL